MIFSILQDYTLRHVIFGAAILGIVSGTLGSFAVLRQRSLLGDTMSHAALPGIALAFMITGSKAPFILLTGAALAGWLGTLAILVITGRTRIKEDGAQGIVLSVFFGIGLVLLSRIQRMPSAAKAGLDKFLFGQAATLLTSDIIAMLVVGGTAMVVMLVLWKEFKLLSFDPEFLTASGFPTRTLEYILTFLIVGAVVIGLQTVGVVLMSAMVVAPAASARQWTNRLEGMVALSGVFGAIAGISGALISSLVEKVPTGPAIVLALGCIAACSLLFGPERGILSQILRRQRNRQTYAANRILQGLWVLSLHHKEYQHPHAIDTLEALFTISRGSVRGGLEALASQGLIKKDSIGRFALTPLGREKALALEGEQS
ncbi:MAG: metal ABC transporter permease [Spirochaetales bacterium]|nr:metal ABC transporter permease [Spirochaetales bacterium]